MNFSSDFYHILQLFCWLLSGYHTVSPGVFKKPRSSGSLPFSWQSSWRHPGWRARLLEGGKGSVLVMALAPPTFLTFGDSRPGPPSQLSLTCLTLDKSSWKAHLASSNITS